MAKPLDVEKLLSLVRVWMPKMNSASPTETDELERRLLIEAIYRALSARFPGLFYGIDRPAARTRKTHFGCRSLSMLQHRVLHEPAIVPELLNFLTIQVSDMFRDPSYFKALRDRVIPHLVTYPSLKVWVAGCGDGEELYSLAILFREEGLASKTIFYATDINPAALKKAEAGVYDLDRIPLFTENHRRSGGKTSLSTIIPLHTARRYSTGLTRECRFLRPQPRLRSSFRGGSPRLVPQRADLFRSQPCRIGQPASSTMRWCEMASSV